MSRHLDVADFERRKKRNKLFWIDVEMGAAATLLVSAIAIAGSRGGIDILGATVLVLGAALFIHCLVIYPIKPDPKKEIIVHEEGSPWWCCPECGEIRFHAVVVFEKGEWEDDETTYVEEYPPAGIVNTVEANVLECTRCQHRFNPSEVFGWYKKAEVPG